MAYAYCAYSVCTVAEENPTHPTAEPTAAYCSCVIENGAPDIDLSVDTGPPSAAAGRRTSGGSTRSRVSPLAAFAAPTSAKNG